jgi:hypothetical protein
LVIEVTAADPDTDAPPNVISPAGLADRATKFAHMDSETIHPGEAGLGALGAVGGSYGVRMLVELATRLSAAAAT